jgi:hypothetical protein
VSQPNKKHNKKQSQNQAQCCWIHKFNNSAHGAVAVLWLLQSAAGESPTEKEKLASADRQESYKWNLIECPSSYKTIKQIVADPMLFMVTYLQSHIYYTCVATMRTPRQTDRRTWRNPSHKHNPERAKKQQHPSPNLFVGCNFSELFVCFALCGSISLLPKRVNPRKRPLLQVPSLFFWNLHKQK